MILFASERLSERGALWTVRPDGSDLTQLFADGKGRFPIDRVVADGTTSCSRSIRRATGSPIPRTVSM
jgi:hypothetical protein